ncbi:unnamed protein product [Wickerhamomyces anomalus]
MIRLSSSPPKTPDPSKVQDTKHQEYHNPHQYQNNLSKMAQSLYLKLEYNFIISESKTKPKKPLLSSRVQHHSIFTEPK